MTCQTRISFLALLDYFISYPHVAEAATAIEGSGGRRIYMGAVDPPGSTRFPHHVVIWREGERRRARSGRPVLVSAGTLLSTKHTIWQKN